MILGIIDRINLLSILPERGDIVTLKLVKDLTEKIGFSEEEIRDANLRQEGDKVLWETAKSTIKDVELSAKGVVFLYEKLKELSDKGNLDIKMVELFDKFEAAAN